jgi:succinoglycan biosynthesis protein ExoU
MASSDESTDRVVVARGKDETARRCVDVLIAARDRADTIEQAVLSALAQDEVRVVIVIDDGSTDDTTAKAMGCDPEGKRVIVKRLGSSIGPSAARNIGIEISESPWVAILDGDDFFLPGRIGNLLSWSASWDFIADDLLQVPEDATDKVTLGMFCNASLGPRPINLTQFVLGNITRRDAPRRELGFLKPLMRRSFLNQHALRYDETLRLGEDYALYARALAAGGRFLLLPVAGYVSVVRANSLSSRHSKYDLEHLRDSDCKLTMARTLTAAERRALAKHYMSVDCRVQWLAVIEAFKSRNYLRFIAPFFRSRGVTLFLATRLLEEVGRRWQSAMVNYALDRRMSDTGDRR